MNSKRLAFLVALFLVLNAFAGLFISADSNDVQESVFISQNTNAVQREEYIVDLNVDLSNSNYSEALTHRDLKTAKTIAEEVFKLYEEEINKVSKDIEIIDRIYLYLPSFLIKATSDEKKLLENLDFIKKIYKNEKLEAARGIGSSEMLFKDWSEPRVEKSMMTSSNDMIGNNTDLLNKYNGEGSVLAIIDGNMDPTHEAFYLSLGTKPRLSIKDIENYISAEGFSVKGKASELFRSSKVPFGWNYQTNSYDLNPEKEKEAHGQHVSGTVAGNKVAIGNKLWRGVAPEAQLLMMNVMSKGSTSGWVYSRAMTDAIAMDADAVNMSLGGRKAVGESTEGKVREIVDNGYAKDTNFIIAAGNEGEYQGNLNIDTPDFGTIATPGNVRNAITVASLENKMMNAAFVTLNGRNYIFSAAGEAKYSAGDYEYVECGIGKTSDFDGKDVSGKIALVKRGTISFNEKILNAADAGAIGVIVYNNVKGMLSMLIDNHPIPAILVELSTGEKMIESSKKTIHIDMKEREVENPDYGEFSAFSNWGLTSGGYMKPDISAPGGHIYSTQTMGNTFGDMSGTSMATPHVTGAIGVLRKRLNEDLFKSAKSKAELTKIILMNSAVPHNDIKTGAVTSPRRQGAGMLNVKEALSIDFTVVDTDTRVPSKFVGNVKDSIKLNLTVKNWSSKRKKITPSIQATIEARDKKVMKRRPEELFTETLENDIFELEPGQEKDIVLNIPLQNLDKISDFKNGAFIDGFIHLRDQNDMEISFPFVSFRGEYETIPSIEKPVYDFDFNEEKPMYWNIKTSTRPWFRFSTHIETNFGLDTENPGLKKYVIAGIKNFDEIDKNKNTEKEPSPIFEDIVISPNVDGKYDEFNPYIVATRGGSFRAEILKEKNAVVLKSSLGDHPSNISDVPDDPDGAYGAIGFYALRALSVRKLEEGKYTLRIYGKAFKGVGEYYPEVSKDIVFYIDKTAPKVTDMSYDEGTRIYSMKIVENETELRDIVVSAGDRILDYEFKFSKLSFEVPEDVELSDVKIDVFDMGYNGEQYNAEYTISPELYGTLKVSGKSNDYRSPGMEFKVVNENGKEVKNFDKIKFGKYKLIVISYKDEEYTIEREKEISFEVSEANKDVKIEVPFKKIPRTEVTIKPGDTAGVKNEDIDLYVTNVETGDKEKLKYDDGGWLPTTKWTTTLGKGNYKFEGEVRGKTTYEFKFSKSMPILIDPNESGYVDLSFDVIDNTVYEMGTVKFTLVEVDGGIETPFEKELTATIDGRIKIKSNEVKEVKLGKHNIKLDNGWNSAEKYDLYGSTIKADFELTKENNNSEHMFKLVLKKASNDGLKKQLKDLIGDENNVNNSDKYKYADRENKEKYDAAVQAGEDILKKSDATEVELKNAIKEIKLSINKLNGVKPVDTTALQELVDKFNEVMASKKFIDAKSEEKDAYQFAIAKASEILNAKTKTEEEVKNAEDEINKTYNALSGDVIPEEKTDVPTVNKAFVNDKFISGEGIKGANIFYTVNEEEITDLISAGRVNEDGKFSIALDELKKDDVILVYQQQHSMKMSDGVKVEIIALDKSLLKEVIDKSEKIKNGEKYKNASEEMKKAFDDALLKAIETYGDENASFEEIEIRTSDLNLKISDIMELENVQYDVIFVVDNKIIHSVAVNAGEKVEPFEMPEKENFHFDGWFKDAAFEEKFDFEKSIEKSITVYGKLVENEKYTVSFVTGTDEIVPSQTVYEGEIAIEPLAPSRNGYRFKGWKLDGVTYNFRSPITRNITLVADWEEIILEPALPTPTPTPEEPSVPHRPYRPKPNKPVTPTKDIVKDTTKPAETTKPTETVTPVEEKKDYGIVETAPTIAATFSDLPENEKAGSIMNIVSRGVLKGMDNGKFEGELPITRAMVATVLKRLSKDQTTNTVQNFKDVKDKDWFAEAAKWAQSQNLIKGYEDGTFKANKLVTRQELAIIVDRFLKIRGIQMKEIKEISYKDLDKLPTWSRDAIIAMAKIGLIEGETTEKYNPTSEFTREELAVMLEKIIEWVEKH